MTDLLRQDETLSASTTIRATPDEVYAIVSDVTRIPEWSPETAKVVWLDGERFRSWNQRRLGLWRTDARVVTAEPGREFSFLVHVKSLGGDWTEWTYRIERGAEQGESVLTEQFRICVDLPLGARLFELLFLFVKDRRADLRENLARSVAGVKRIAESR